MDLPGYLCLDGNEVVNHCRTMAYIAAGLSTYWSGSAGECECCCSSVDDGDYTTPGDEANNPAPWYDAARPESAQFFGILLNEFTTTTGYAADRRTYGRACPRPTPRTFVLRGSLVASTCAGTAYGKEWLARALAPVCVDAGCCDELDGVVLRYCDDDTSTDPGRSTKDVRLLEITFGRDVGGVGDDDAMPCCQGTEFEAILEADPYLFAESETCVIDGTWNLDPNDPDAVCYDWECLPCGSCDTCMGWIECDDPCGPAIPVAPDPPQLPECFCEPILSSRQCCKIDPIPSWTDAVLRITVFAGSEPLRNLRIRVWRNHPADIDPSSADGHEEYRCMEPCAVAEIAEIPKYGTLTVDGTTERSTLELNRYTYPADNLIWGPSRTVWTYPVLICGGEYWVCADADIYNTAADATLTVEIIPREMS